MTPFFDPPHVGLLREAADAWRGTPFRKRARLRGAGVDCINLVLALYDAAGLNLDVELPHYGLFDGACRADAGPIIDWLECSERFWRLWRRGEPIVPIEAGDLLCLNIELSVHHVGIALDGLNFFHILQGGAAGSSPTLDSTYVNKLQAIYRPLRLPRDDQRRRFQGVASLEEESED